jgi:Protein of unknown function (DUF1549)/Protein of unknown function (DUF1553)
MRLRDLIFVSVVLGGGLALARGALRPPAWIPPHLPETKVARANLQPIVAEINADFERRRAEKGVRLASPAAELTVLRRLSLALTGSIPSLEEVRQFEALPGEGRIEGWLDELLRDRRTADYLAERFARALVGTEDGPFVKFRRRRFTTWLSDAILENRPYDTVVRDLIADQGLWTDHPATNFVSVTISEETELPDPERLAARVSRAFLGVRLDCAQCHDHPFQPWKQADFRGLAAFFGSVHSNLRGVRDGETAYHPLDRNSKQAVTVQPRVPFHPELLPAAGGPREQLAGWIVNPGNPSLARATVNRVWALLFGRPLVDPVDDLAASAEPPPVLLLLAGDFSAHGFDLHRLIRIIAATEVYRVESTDISPTDSDGTNDETWASFPMTRLRPEQVAGALFQAASLPTLGSQSPWIVRLAFHTGRNDFVRRYGDTGEDEFAVRGGTIPQRLLLMNGELVREKTKDDLFNASRRIAELAPDDRKAIEVAYLTVLTRRPTSEELSHFESRLAGTKNQERKDRLTDLFWTMLNTTEFSWNH